MSEFPTTAYQAGQVQWIGASRASRSPILALSRSQVDEGTGLREDHHARSGRSKRQVTIMQWEHLPVIAAILNRDSVTPELLRRNIAVSNINVLSLEKRKFWIGEVLLEGTGICEPCSRMEETLGQGGLQAMCGHGGITARVLQGGEITLGSKVAFFSIDPSDEGLS